MSDNPSHSPEFWAAKPRSLREYVVGECEDVGDNYRFATTEGSGFIRAKADVGAALQPGDRFELETVNWSVWIEQK